MCLRPYFTQEEERAEIFYYSHLYPNSESQIVCLL